MRHDHLDLSRSQAGHEAFCFAAVKCAAAQRLEVPANARSAHVGSVEPHIDRAKGCPFRFGTWRIARRASENTSTELALETNRWMWIERRLTCLRTAARARGTGSG